MSELVAVERETQFIYARHKLAKKQDDQDRYVLPRGMARDGGLGDKSLKWTSTYGSVVASVFEGGTADGMNEI